MALAPGQQLGSYEILAPIGAGAMGQVYRAKDTRLDREIAIKVLPEDFAKDEERLHRFQREAKSLASLNHVNIAQIYSVDQIDDTNFLSLEFVPGQTLDEILQRGPLPLEEALRIGRDIATGLEVAHEAGVIHRDLKPANIRVTPDGVAKVLDFGLAKPTGTNLLETKPKSALTQADGRLLGTPTYMAPEQIAGKPIDRRIDIWAFGCVLYECLTGKRAFDADSVGTLFAAIATEPIDLRKLSAAPAPVRRLLERCLRKDPQERLRDAGDARVVLSDVLAGRGDEEPAQAAATRGSRAGILIGMLAVGVLGAVAGWLLAPGQRDEPTPIARYSIALPPPSAALILDSPTGSAPPLTISADGRRVAIAARDTEGIARVYERTATNPKWRPVKGTVGADFAFFSEDGEHLGYAGLSSKELHRINRDGSVQPIRERTTVVRGASWGHGWLIFGDQDSGLMMISPDGKNEKTLTNVDDEEFYHIWPQVLPGGKRVLYTAYLKRDQLHQPRLFDLETGTSTPFADVRGTCARFLADADGSSTGFLVYVRVKDLWAARVDVKSAAVLGKPQAVVRGIHVSQLGIPHFALSASGVLVYEPARPPSFGRELVWVDRSGREVGTLCQGKGFEFPRLHPKESKVLFAHHTEMAIHELWACDFSGDRPLFEKISSKGNFVQPIWSPDGKGVMFSDFRTRNMYVQDPISADRSRVAGRRGWQCQREWHANGRLLFHEMKPGNQWDLLEMDLASKERPVRELVATEDSESSGGSVSANGKWYVYVSDDTGKHEVYVARYHLDWDKKLGPRQNIAPGTEPVWAKTKSELFFRRGNSLFAVQISDADGRATSKPEELFDGQFVPGFNQVPNYDVTQDGKRFVMVKGGFSLTTGRLDVHLNFRAELEAKLPRTDK